MLFGHLAVARLLHRYLKVEPVPLYVASYFPDAVDKTFSHALAITNTGRYVAHTVWALGLSTWVVRKFWGDEAAKAWAIGYLMHMVADIDGLVPWFYPLASYDFPQKEKTLRQIVHDSLAVPKPAEVGLSLWAAATILEEESS